MTCNIRDLYTNFNTALFILMYNSALFSVPVIPNRILQPQLHLVPQSSKQRAVVSCLPTAACMVGHFVVSLFAMYHHDLSHVSHPPRLPPAQQRPHAHARKQEHTRVKRDKMTSVLFYLHPAALPLSLSTLYAITQLRPPPPLVSQEPHVYLLLPASNALTFRHRFRFPAFVSWSPTTACMLAHSCAPFAYAQPCSQPPPLKPETTHTHNSR
jgi:hypothetical protein